DAQIRDQASTLEFQKILLRKVSLPPLELAEQLEAFSKQARFAETTASDEAAAEAARIRREEAERLAAEEAHAERVSRARETLGKRLSGWIETGDYRAAAAGFQPEDIDAAILASPELQQLITEQKKALNDAAAARLQTMRADARTAIEKKDPAAALAAADALAAVSDATTGWPDSVLP